MQRGGKLEIVLFIGACILVLVTGALVFTRQDINHDKAIEEQNFREMMHSLESSIKQTNSMLDDVSGRVKLVEEKKEIDVNIKNPVQVIVVRKHLHSLPPLPSIEIHHAQKPSEAQE